MAYHVYMAKGQFVRGSPSNEFKIKIERKSILTMSRIDKVENISLRVKNVLSLESKNKQFS